MEITPGISSTAAAIQRNQARFDTRAEQVVADAEALSSGPAPAAATAASADPASGTGDLTSDVVGLHSDSMVNSVLYSVFKKQLEQQRSLIDLIDPSPK
ncbi:hypothetical protein LBMAG53_02950 [Planctomycetota bacterium]|nr:hypothetical protein LBMAG53_02950 [Planctomycetota bacterium]